MNYAKHKILQITKYQNYDKMIANHVTIMSSIFLQIFNKFMTPTDGTPCEMFIFDL